MNVKLRVSNWDRFIATLIILFMLLIIIGLKMDNLSLEEQLEFTESELIILTEELQSIKNRNEELEEMMIEDGEVIEEIIGHFNRKDITEPSNITPEMAEELLRGGLKGLGEDFLEVAKEYGINVKFMIAVSRLETGNGSYKYMDRNNLFSLGAYTNNPDNAFSFDSKRESIEYFAELINNDYLNRGLKSVRQINSRYAEDTKWAEKVIEIIE